MSKNLPDPSASRQKEERPTHNHSANNHSASSQDTVTLTVGLTPAFKRLLEAKAKSQGISVSELLGNILRADIARHENAPPTPPRSRGPWSIVLLFASFATFCSLSLADSLTGEVVRVVDGDTVVVCKDSRAVNEVRGRRTPLRIRLAEIDAPELRQAYGPEAKAALESLVLRKIVVVDYRKKDRYRRIIGTVRLNRKSINAEMIRRGHAWHYRRYSRNAALIALESGARSKRLGLWQAPSPTPPWEFRRPAKK